VYVNARGVVKPMRRREDPKNIRGGVVVVGATTTKNP
jgi:hypothetical protein